MDNLRTATALALIAHRNIVLQAEEYVSCREALVAVLAHSFDVRDVVEVDLLEEHSFEQLVERMVIRVEGQPPTLHQVVLWRNLDKVDSSLGTRIGITTVFDQLERYNTLAARHVTSSPVKLGPYTVQVPEISLIVPILESRGGMPKLSQAIKDRFWFCQSYVQGSAPVPVPFSRSQLRHARASLASVYASPAVHEYVCSLLVFTRSHRLCSLAPLSTRPGLRAQTGIMLLAKALVTYTQDSASRFVTPEYIKLAFRKIAYWLVDWETNPLFSGHHDDLDFQKRTEVSILTGDWYGCEWEGVQRYLEDHASMQDVCSTTGFTNRLVEEVLDTVAPPL